ncbi:Holliday junction branch migration protein RuvA [Pseudoclavibacter sp. JSM 162008]|uniref:Holliday junction branch migration protein RuvA n=1 Tax=Pseudoclavibacter sp. JSM 162008 TaxID=3229855 RepID=UPI00352555A6
MIASLRGQVLYRTATTVTIEAAGVGYQVFVTPAHALQLRLDAEVLVRTHLVVREDAWTLYGFQRSEELEIFEHLITVTGVGPKSALGVLAHLEPEQVARAVAEEDVKAFTAVSGIGPKTAKLIILSLAGKIALALSPSPAAGEPVGQNGSAALRRDVVEALLGLGYAERQAAPAVEDAAKALDGEDPDVAALLRATLKLLGPAGSRS